MNSDFPALICSVNNKLQIESTPNRGRYCITKSEIARKAPIITGQPYAFAFTKSFSRYVCAWSLDEFDGTLHVGCPDCGEVWYESEKERALGFRYHHPECKAFQKIHSYSSLNASYKMLMKTMARAIIRKAFEKGLQLPVEGIKIKAQEKKWLEHTEIPEWRKDKLNWNHMLALVSNRESYGTRRFKARLGLADKLMDALPKEVIRVAFKTPEAARDEIAETICRYECNCFGYFGPKGNQTGAAVIPGISYINHSCVPNARTFYYKPGGPITVEATEDLKAGQEVNISYCETSWSKKARQEYLKHHYFFLCNCPKCSKTGAKKP